MSRLLQCAEYKKYHSPEKLHEKSFLEKREREKKRIYLKHLIYLDFTESVRSEIKSILSHDLLLFISTST